MRKENNKGITLIALIVTIIVLVIIAGISIAALTSDNGIIRQTNVAKIEKIEGTAREQVKLAISAMKLAIAEASSKDNSYRADNNAGKIQAKLVEILNQDKSGLNGTFGFGGNDLDDAAAGTELTISYTGDDYQNACNDTNADIVYTVTLGQKSIELTDETNATLKDQNQNDADIDVGGNIQSVPPNKEIDEEYGLYFDTPYSVESTDMKLSFVARENGTLELYGTQGDIDGMLYQTFTNVVYGWKTITFEEGTFIVSSDGRTITLDTETFVCAFEEYHDVYFDEMYISQVPDAIPSAKLYEDGRMVFENGSGFPAGTLSYTSSHIIGIPNGEWRVSIDGRRIYSPEDGLIYVVNEDAGATEKLETPTISISGDILTITQVPNATSYEVHVDGKLRETITTNTVDLTTIKNLAAGTHEITVKAKASGYIKSDASTVGNYTVTVTQAISKTESYVGYYANLDEDPEPEGIIYADLAIGGSGEFVLSDETRSYSYSSISGTKDYYISKNNYAGTFGKDDDDKKRDIITVIPNSTGEDRFYVMELADFTTADYTSFYWYYSAYTNGINDYSTLTSANFGTGKSNTANMIAAWNAERYGEKNNQDMWGVIQDKVSGGWFVPSSVELVVFGGELGITSLNYSDYGLSRRYWSSRIGNADSPWIVSFYDGYAYSGSLNGLRICSFECDFLIL